MHRKKLIIAGAGLSIFVVLVAIAIVGHGRPYSREMMGEERGKGENNFEARGNRGEEQSRTGEKMNVVEYVVDSSDYINSADFTNGEEVLVALSDEEKNGILLMREEEKLARDVYTVLGEKWGIKIFSNIAASEQTHMTVMGDLVSKYGLVDPVTSNDIGIFTNPDFQKLYSELTERGLTSSAEALQVGATIEDLDIYDLERLIAGTDKPDIISVYQNLMKGSRNHLRAFTGQITRSKGEYVAKYISQVDYQTIIDSQQERGKI